VEWQGFRCVLFQLRSLQRNSIKLLHVTDSDSIFILSVGRLVRNGALVPVYNGPSIVRFEVLKASRLKMRVFWIVAASSVAGVLRECCGRKLIG
jgi:hypothetical protein